MTNNEIPHGKGLAVDARIDGLEYPALGPKHVPGKTVQIKINARVVNTVQELRNLLIDVKPEDIVHQVKGITAETFQFTTLVFYKAKDAILGETLYALSIPTEIYQDYVTSKEVL